MKFSLNTIHTIGWFFELLIVIMNWEIIEIEIVLNFNLNFIRIFY